MKSKIVYQINFDAIHFPKIPIISSFIEDGIQYEEYKSNLIQNDFIQDQADDQVVLLTFTNHSQSLNNSKKKNPIIWQKNKNL